MRPMRSNNVGRLAHLRQALDAADAVARQLCTCPAAAAEAHPLLLKLESIRAELDLLAAFTEVRRLPPACRPYLFDPREAAAN